MEETQTPVAVVRKPRGFATMSLEDRKRIASKGGKKAHQLGKAHTFTPEEARAAGSKGGSTPRRTKKNEQQQTDHSECDQLAGTPAGGKD